MYLKFPSSPHLFAYFCCKNFSNACCKFWCLFDCFRKVRNDVPFQFCFNTSMSFARPLSLDGFPNATTLLSFSKMTWWKITFLHVHVQTWFLVKVFGDCKLCKKKLSNYEWSAPFKEFVYVWAIFYRWHINYLIAKWFGLVLIKKTLTKTIS